MTRPAPGAPKAVWREWAFAVRRKQPDASPAVVEALRSFLHARGARRVLAYHALPGEPDVAALQADFELLTTRTRFRPERHLTLHPYATATEVSRAGYRQPPANAPQVPLGSVDAVLLPGLAFDERGTRLGYGGGFYDRTLAALHAAGHRPRTIGVAYEVNRVESIAPQSHDIALDCIVTERGVV